MAMQMGAGPNRVEMNVTPLIDVLLVLLIIFMLIVPQRSNGLRTDVPQPSSDVGKSNLGDIVMTVQSEGRVLLNHEPVPMSDLEARLKGLFRFAPNHALFVDAEPGLEFAQVAEAIDTARGAGLHTIALMPRERR